ncbi:MAG: protein kinase domain-containing protein [Akkermansiaceae bacterium]
MSETIPFDPPEPTELTHLLEGYTVTAMVATGGMGAVYKAVQDSLDRFVAIKLLPAELGADKMFRDQFRAEARSMARLNHANLIGIYDFGEANGMPYIVMEFVAGKSLYYSSYGKAIDQSTAAELIIGISRGLAHAHRAGIIHRDVKPANILLDPKAQPKIGDFGLAAAADSDGDDSLIYGTPGYAAPEILSNPKAIGVPSDIFAVGVIFYELLTGKMPEEPPSPPSSIARCDKRLDPIFKKATRRNPALRYQDADELADDLQAILPDLGNTQQRTIRTRSGNSSQKSVTLKRRLTTNKEPGDSKPRLVALSKAGSAPTPKLKSLADESDDESVNPAPAPAPVSMETGSNWPIIRNLLIIAVLIPVIIFTWGIYKDKRAKLKQEKEDQEQKRKQEQRQRDKIADKSRREAEEVARMEAERKVREAENAKKRAELLAIKKAKTPMQKLAEYRTALYNGRRDRFPEGTIDRSTHYLFFVQTPMSWGEACAFAEQHGGHLATPVTQADVDVLTSRMGTEIKKIWIGGGAKGRNGWAWVTGEEWRFPNPGITLGSCASLSSSGVIRARPNGEKNPFVVQWSRDGQNPGSLASQLERLVPTLEAPSPEWPPATISNESRHFLLVQQPVTWQEADLVAASSEGHLAVISEPSEDRFLSDFFEESLQSDQSIWLGAILEGDLWTWTTSEPWVKASWAPGSPSSGASETALRFIKTGSGMGWDDANPRSKDISGFLIEWSPDAKRKEVVEAVSQANPIASFTKARKIARHLVKKEIDDYEKFLLGNRDAFLAEAKVWFRVLNNSEKRIYQIAYDNLDTNLPADGDFTGLAEIKLPPELRKYLNRAIERQNRYKAKLDQRMEVLRRSYLNKLANLQAIFENNGLKSQMGTIAAEISSVGQTAASFRTAMGR